MADRLEELRGDLSVNAFAHKCGIGESLMRKYLAGASPSTDKLTQISRASGVTVEWLATGEGPKLRSELESLASRSANQVAEPPAGYSFVRMYDVRASAGGGVVPFREDVVHQLAFREDWIRGSLRATGPEDLSLLTVEGKSMEPELFDRDIILVAHKDKLAREGLIYVVRFEDALLVKRVQRLESGALRLISSNLAYSAMEISPERQEDPGFAIIGRVVWACRRL